MRCNIFQTDFILLFARPLATYKLTRKQSSLSHKTESISIFWEKVARLFAIERQKRIAFPTFKVALAEREEKVFQHIVIAL